MKPVMYDRNEAIRKLYYEGKSRKKVAEEMSTADFTMTVGAVAGVVKWVGKNLEGGASPSKLSRTDAVAWYEKTFPDGASSSPSTSPKVKKAKAKKVPKATAPKARPKDLLTFDVSVQVGQWDEISAMGNGMELKRYHIDVHNQILPLMFFAGVDNTVPTKDLKEKRLVDVDVLGINLPDEDTKNNWDSGKYPMKIIKLDNSLSLEVVTGGSEKFKDAYDSTIERLVMLEGMPREIAVNVLKDYNSTLEYLKKLRKSEKKSDKKKALDRDISRFEDAKKDAEKKKPGNKEYLTEQMKYSIMGADYTVSDAEDYKKKDLDAIVKNLKLGPGQDDPEEIMDLAGYQLEYIYDYPNFLILYKLLANEFYAIMKFIDFYDDYLKKDKKDLGTLLAENDVFKQPYKPIPNKLVIPCTNMHVKGKKYESFDEILKIYKVYCKSLNDILPVNHKMGPKDILFYHELKNLEFYNGFFKFNKDEPLEFSAWIGEVLFIAPRKLYREFGSFYWPFEFKGDDLKNFKEFEVILEPGIKLILDYYDLLGDKTNEGWSIKITTDKMVGKKIAAKKP